MRKVLWFGRTWCRGVSGGAVVGEWRLAGWLHDYNASPPVVAEVDAVLLGEEQIGVARGTWNSTLGYWERWDVLRSAPAAPMQPSAPPC